MSDEQNKAELKEYAGGWITERKGTGIPGFLKIAYPVILVALIAYTFVYMNGEVNHPTRGGLVQQLNAVTGNANVFMYIVVALMAIFGVILLAFVYGKDKHED